MMKGPVSKEDGIKSPMQVAVWDPKPPARHTIWKCIVVEEEYTFAAY